MSDFLPEGYDHAFGGVNWNAIEGLLSRSSFSTWEKDSIRDRVISIDSNWNAETSQEYFQIIDRLKDSKIDPIAFGFNYKQTDILNHIKSLA